MLAIYNILLNQRLSVYRDICEKYSILFNPLLIKICHSELIQNPHNFQNNIFFHEQLKVFILKLYYDSIKLQYCFKKYIIRYNNKRIKACNTHDMLMAPIDLNKKSELITILDRRKKYIFKWTDLFNIITTSLIHGDEYLFSIPNPIKNPYTGLIFSKELLYLIYIEAQHSTFHIPILFTLYMKTDFDLNEFNVRYDSILKPYIIENKIHNFTTIKLQREIITMFRDLIIFNQINNEMNITISYPEKIPTSIIIHFKPLLIHYYNYIYLSDLYVRHLEYSILIKKIIAFKRENINFDFDYIIKTPIQKVNYKIITIPKFIINIEL